MDEEIRLNDFTKAYLKAALFTNIDNNFIDKTYSIFDIDENHLVQVKEDCLDFQAKCGRFLFAAYAKGYTEDKAGHDFWLTRNGHQIGFLDRNLSEIGAELEAKSKEFGESKIYRDEEHKVYFTNLPYDRRQQRFRFK